MSRQLSLFGVESVDASPADVAGLLAGPGRLHRMGGTARVSVRVDAAWRVHALIAELTARGLEASWRRIAADPDNSPADPDDSPATPTPTPTPAGPTPAGPTRGGPTLAGLPSAGSTHAGSTLVGSTRAGRTFVGPGEADADDQWADDAADDFPEEYPDPREYPDDDPGGRVVGGPSLAAGEPLGEWAGTVETTNGDDEADLGGGGDGAGDDQRAEGGNGGVGHSGSGAGSVAVFEVRTAYSSLLVGLTRTWLDGAAKLGPRRFFLTGPRLRLWAVAAGSPYSSGYELCWGVDDGPQVRAVVVAALAQAGLGGETVQVDGGPPVYRIAGRRGLARLAELVGERPSAVPADRWPQAWRA